MCVTELALTVIGVVLGPICNLFCGDVSSKMTTTLKLRSNLDDMVRDMKNLRDCITEVKQKKEEAEKEGKDIRPRVVTLLEEVEKLELKVNPIQEEKPSACFLNCYKRYRESKEVEDILEEIKRLKLNIPAVVYSTTIPKAVEHIPGPSIPVQSTAYKTLQKTMSLLKDDRYRVIGIWGLGGVGKSTLVRTLNNELEKSTSTHPFGIVIWATVSKDWDMRQVQARIAKRLNLEVKTEESVQEIAIRLHQRLMIEEKFLLILDDVWENVDLSTLGVPQHEVHKGCKIILTSRRMEVCRKMMTVVEVKMDVLNNEEAWQLFCQKAGDVAHLEEIRPFAEAIARECCGLPLANIVVGAAMRGKTKVELWKHALKELRSSVPFIADIEAEIYKPLRWSYDSLEDINNIKSCFLYCSLYPEDDSIPIYELELCWQAEGLIVEQQNYFDAKNTVIALIEKLKDSCLLEDGEDVGTVKMHDVVRDVAIWIAKSSKDGCKSLVRSGIGLREISVGEFSNKNSLKRVSFMKNYITRLPDCVIEQCSEASTLLLHGNPFLRAIPERFLQGFEALSVLNLSGTCIRSLPLSLLQLGDLCALLLSNCVYLEKLPPLGGLSRLQVLDLSLSGIRKLSRGMENLCNLRQLDLSHTRNLKTIQAGILSSLSNLEVLDMAESACYLILKGEEREEGRTTFEELRYLDRLLIVSIRLNSVPHLTPEDLSWITRLRGFQFFIGPERGFRTRITTTNDKRVIIRRVSRNFLPGLIRQLLDIAKSLVLDECRGLFGILKKLVSVSGFASLKSLTITGSSMGSQPIPGLDGNYDRLPNLEELTLNRVDGLASISYLVNFLGLRFLRLKSIKVGGCSGMKCLLGYDYDELTLPNLEVIKVDTCENLESLFFNKKPNLRTLELENLPKLTTLDEYEETWPCIEQIGVFRCNSLRRLPLTKQNAGTIKEIKGDSKWWDALQWNDGVTKSTLLPYFRPTLPKSLGFGGGNLNNDESTVWPL